ncbi:MAG: hypothetical protein QW514_08930 [Thermoprotei archaeon]
MELADGSHKSVESGITLNVVWDFSGCLGHIKVITVGELNPQEGWDTQTVGGTPEKRRKYPYCSKPFN